jgi:hypothetical protein
LLVIRAGAVPFDVQVDEEVFGCDPDVALEEVDDDRAVSTTTTSTRATRATMMVRMVVMTTKRTDPHAGS